MRYPYMTDAAEMDRRHKAVLQAMEKAKNITNSFRDFSYLIISGGTGEAWFPQIKEYLSGLKNLTVLAGNMQDPSIPFLYANVRGYYFYRYVRNK